MIKTYLFFFVLFIAGVGGWIANLVKLIGGIDDPITAMFLMRIVGLFAAPLGAILGYF